MPHTVTFYLTPIKRSLSRAVIDGVKEQYQFTVTEKRHLLYSKFTLVGEDVSALETIHVAATMTKMSQVISLVSIAVWAAFSFISTKVIWFHADPTLMLYASALLVITLYLINKMYVDFHNQQRTKAVIRARKAMKIN